MAKVRFFEKNDIEQVIDLNIKSFPRSVYLSRDEQYKKFLGICFENPWYHDSVRSLVYEDNNGKIKGFLGVVPKKFRFYNDEILVGVGQHLMVDMVPLASFQLFKTFFSGPQDLSITDMAVDIGKSIWEKLGGQVIYSYSVYWRRIFKPLSFLYLLKKEREYKNITEDFLLEMFNIVDKIIYKLPIAYFKIPQKPDVELENMNTKDFLENFDSFIGSKVLKPIYDNHSLEWLFKQLQNEKRFGEFQKIVVIDRNENIVGWFLYNLFKHGRSQVLQIVAKGQTIDVVLEALFYHAWKNGSVELVGRIDPYFMKKFLEKKCLSMPGQQWMLTYSRNKELINALHSGEAFFTRLEGDLWYF